MSNTNGKSKSEIIDEKLMGLEINDGDKDYGVICRIEQINSDFKVYTTLGYSFNAGLILNLIAMSNLYDKANTKAEENEDENVEYLPPAIIHNARLSNKIMSKPKPMAHTKTLRSNGSIDNNAHVGNNETISIISHTSNAEPFPEESSYSKEVKKKNLTIDEVCELNGITVEQYIEMRKS